MSNWINSLLHLVIYEKAIQSFGNYATAQLRRLQNALARDNYPGCMASNEAKRNGQPQAEKEQHILNSISGQMDHLKRTYKSFTDSEISLYIDQSDKLNKYQIRSEKGIRRFMLLLSLSYVFCNCFVEVQNPNATIGNKRFEARKEIDRCMVDKIYSMANSGLTVEDAYYEFNVANW